MVGNTLSETFKWLIEQVEWVITAIISVGIIVFRRWMRIKNQYQVAWKNSKRLKVKDLQGFTGRPVYQYYHERAIDGVIRANLQAKKGEVKNMVIVGPPLSGKTRSVLQAFREVKRTYDVLVPRIVDIDREKFPVPVHLKLRKKIVFIDDLHLFVDRQNFEVIFEKFKGQVIIATCRSGDEFKKVSGKLADKNLGSLFSEVDIVSISIKAGKEIANASDISWDKVKFNGTVGSIFMPLKDMENRYNKCNRQERTVLLCFREMYQCGVYEENLIFPFEWVEKLARQHGINIDRGEWNELILSLQGKEFVQTLNNERFHCEDVYLEEIVKPPLRKPLLQTFCELVDVYIKSPDVLLLIGDRAWDVGQNSLEISEYMKVSRAAYEKALKDLL